MTDPRQPELFTQGPAAPVDGVPPPEEAVGLAARLPPGILLGTSSWTFPGWAGLVYDREASPGVLATHGLAAYARHPLLGCVGVDRTYYGPLPVATLRLYRDQTPPAFRFVVKADRRLLFPDGPGADPALFLNAAWASDQVVAPSLEGLGEKLGALLFQFPPLSPGAVGGPRAFAESLYRFLAALPAGIPYVVELRTPALLTPDYAAALRHGGAVHGYVVHPEMPTLRRQAEAVPPVPSRPAVIRWMLQPGHRYAEAREAWAPFSTLQAPDAASRSQVAELARAAARAGSPVLVVVNNKAEGSSPHSVLGLARALTRPEEATF
ncbi:MAG TPA: DUF72 domain-containing protein [Longimicrobiales bacterium]|nr:DUF72 domain-containing protein [Longimicrobiales bacterium]